MSVANKITGLAYSLLGVGFAIRGVQLLLDDTGAPDLDDRAPRLARGSVGDFGDEPGAVRAIQAREHYVKNIEERVELIRERIKKGGLSPKLHLIVGDILGHKCGPKGSEEWCTAPRDWRAEKIVLFNALQDPSSKLASRYSLDMRRADTFKSVDVQLDHPGADCDDQVIKLGAALEAAGHPVMLTAAQVNGAADYSHIWLLSGMPPDSPTEWMPLDPTVAEPAGWEVPGAAEARRTGKASGYVVKIKDFEV